jgi:hypothetical protein
MIVELATRSATGRPFLTPLWFVVDRGMIYATTGPESRAGKNVARHPEVGLLFAGERTDETRRLLRARGNATRHHGLPPWRVLVRIAVKYYVSPRALRVELRNARRFGLRRRYYGQGAGGLGYLRIAVSGFDLVPRPASG